MINTHMTKRTKILAVSIVMVMAVASGCSSSSAPAPAAITSAPTAAPKAEATQAPATAAPPAEKSEAKTQSFKDVTDSNFNLPNQENLVPFEDSGLTDAQIKTFARAMGFWDYLNVYNVIDDSLNNEERVLAYTGDIPFYSTDYGYDSFMTYASQIFSKNILNAMPENLNEDGGALVMRSPDGELLENGGARGGNTYYLGYAVEVTSSTDKEIDFNIIAYFAEEGSDPEDENAPMYGVKVPQKLTFEENGNGQGEDWYVDVINGWW